MADTESTKKGDGGSIPEEGAGAASKAAGGPPPGGSVKGATATATRPGATAAAPKAAAREEEAPPPARELPEVPEGFVLFENTSEDPVRFTLRDGENIDREFKCAKGKTVLVPKPYADLVPGRAPQLRRIAG